MPDTQNTNYLIEIFQNLNKGVYNKNSDLYKIHFIFRNVITHDAVPPDNVAGKLGLEIGQIAPAGLSPRLTLARSEAYWLIVSLQTMAYAFKKANIKFPFAITVSYPESIVQNMNGCYLANPLLLEPKLNLQDAIAFMHDFSINGEDKSRETDFIFNFNRFFKISPIKGFIKVDSKSLVFMAGSSDDLARRSGITIALQEAENQGAMILEKPRYWLTDYNNKNFGYGDAKSFAKNLCPEHYPPSYEGRNVDEAIDFIKQFPHCVLKPASSANGNDVTILRFNDHSDQEISEQFKNIFEGLLSKYPHPQRLILQKFISGIEQYGETRIFVYDNKVFPVGICLKPEDGQSLCKIFMNADIQTVFLDNEILHIAKKFIERSASQGLSYYGLDLIKDHDGKYYMTEANFLISGFFDRIAHVIDTQKDDIEQHVNLLDDDLKPYIITSHLNDTIYKKINQFLKTRLVYELQEANTKAMELLRSPFNFRNKKKFAQK